MSEKTQNQLPKRVIPFFIMFHTFVASPVAGAMDCPIVSPDSIPSSEDLDSKISWKGIAEPYMARYTMRYGGEPAYGVGYLEILNSVDDYYYNWHNKVILPLWKLPNEKSFYGWLRNGRIHPNKNDVSYILTGAGLVETQYEHNNFIVYQVFDEGWLRIKLKPGQGGEVWTHRCHLEMGNVKLIFKGWASFLWKHGDWLHFRTQVPHSLREHPSVNSSRITMIGLDHKLVLLEIKGDWMHVIVEQPDQTCASIAERTNIHKGWVKWRDDKKGPWVWVYTRGC